MTQQMFWLEIAKLVATLLATGVVGWLTYSIQSSQRDIAAVQARTAAAAKQVSQAKLNLDLFEERYAVFLKVWSFLSSAINGKDADPNFTNEIPKAQFLFGESIADFMREASKNQIDLAVLEKKMRRAGYVYSNDDEKRLSELHTWFFSEASNCFKRFGDYLDLSSWKADPIDRLLNIDAV